MSKIRHTRNAIAPSRSALWEEGILQRACACGNHAHNGDECEPCRKKRLARESMMQRAAVNTAEVEEVPEIVYDVLRSPGQPLDDKTRAYMEPRFGQDFSSVRVHTDGRAAASARAVNALAYAVGQHVVFGIAQYAPESSAGKRLLAHELTHTLQQSLDPIGANTNSMKISSPRSGSEREAEDTAARIVSGQPTDSVTPSCNSSGTALQRLGDQTKIPLGLTSRCPVAPNSPTGIAEQVRFPTRVSSLSSLQRDQIDNFVMNWRASGGNADVRVDGFASRPGTDELNWQLSCDRAQAVAAELMYPSSGTTQGIPENFIEIYMHGETSEFGSQANNQMVAISLSAPPTPPPPPPPPMPFPRSIHFWFNAFIPNTVSGHRPAPAGPFAGREVFPSPPHPFHINSCFETDDRGFISTPGASSRVRVDANLDTITRRLPFTAISDLTFELDCTTGALKCARIPRPRVTMIVLPPTISTTDFDIAFTVTSNDPCVTGSPDLAIRGLVTIERARRIFTYHKATTFYPAFEMYMEVGGPVHTVFRQSPVIDSPFALFSPGVHLDRHSVSF